MKALIFLLVIFIPWIILWYVSYKFINKRASSKTVAVGGGFISSCILLALISLLLLPFISNNKKEYKKIDAANEVKKEQINKNTGDIEFQINIRKKIIENKTIIYGETNFPEGTKLGVSIYKKDKLGPQDFAIYVSSGRFMSQPLTSNGDLLEDDCDVKIFTYFNQSWQTSEQLRENLKRYKSPYLTNEHRLNGTMVVKFEIVKRLSDLNY